MYKIVHTLINTSGIHTYVLYQYIMYTDVEVSSSLQRILGKFSNNVVFIFISVMQIIILKKVVMAEGRTTADVPVDKGKLVVFGSRDRQRHFSLHMQQTGEASDIPNATLQFERLNIVYELDGKHTSTNAEFCFVYADEDVAANDRLVLNASQRKRTLSVIHENDFAVKGIATKLYFLGV